MHLCFLDESGTPAKPGHPSPKFFVIAGVIIPEDIWHSAREKLIGLKREKKFYGEVKWRFFAPNNSDEDNPMRAWSQEDRNEFRSRVFQIIKSHRSIKVVACVCNCSEAYKIRDINSQDDIYFQTYKPVTERFQYFLQDISREVGSKISGLVVSDHRGSKDDSKMRLQHERLIRENGRYTSTYTHFVEGLFFSPSHMSVGIQLADMVAGATWRFFERQDDSFFNEIRASFRSKPNGEIYGYGLVKFPKIWLDVGWSRSSTVQCDALPTGIT
jgi:hypothetical protein